MSNNTYQMHPFHSVDPSPWPLTASTSAIIITTGTVSQFHGYTGGSYLINTGSLSISYTIGLWWRDVIREGTMEGQHTTSVQLGSRMGILLFIVSEVMFFVAFFWAFFWAALAPTPEIGSVWPPRGIDVLNAWEVPLSNTIILLASGSSVTWAHHAICDSDRDEGLKGSLVTIISAVSFTISQVWEYVNAIFTISDSVYGSTFYIATGFHGFHVFIGTCFLVVCISRSWDNQFTKQHHFGLEAAAWYWHFVDVVWLFLFVSVYWWGN